MCNVEKHLNTKIPLTLELVRPIWADLDDKARMEVIKSVIWTAPNAQEFAQKVKNTVCSDKFINEID